MPLFGRRRQRLGLGPGTSAIQPIIPTIAVPPSAVPVDRSTAMATSDTPSKPIVILSCSLNPDSRSHKLALAAVAFLRESHHPVELVDLAAHDLPMCGSAGSFDHPAVQALTATIDEIGRASCRERV